MPAGIEEPPPILWSLRCDDRRAFRRWTRREERTIAARRAFEGTQAARVQGIETAIYSATCWVCQSKTPMRFDRRHGWGANLNWRERLICAGCGLNARQRLALHAAVCLVGLGPGARLYLSEALSPLPALLRERGREVTTSEWLPATPRGATDARGLRSEDLERLTFAAGSFDGVLCFDVLEHVVDHVRALGELRRVLAPGGVALLSFPFARHQAAHVVRARVGADGHVTHLLPPEVHENPTDPERGALCYRHFGWQVLADLAAAGFATSHVELFWSKDYGYLGPELVLVVARARR